MLMADLEPIVALNWLDAGAVIAGSVCVGTIVAWFLRALFAPRGREHPVVVMDPNDTERPV